MRNHLAILIASILMIAPICASSAEAQNVDFWLTTEGSGMHISTGDGHHHMPPPPRHKKHKKHKKHKHHKRNKHSNRSRHDRHRTVLPPPRPHNWHH